jgi:hypothetical protein
MKNNIIRFIPVLEKQAEKNLEHLITKAKSSKGFGDIRWEEITWTITESQATDRGHKQRQYRLWFTQHGENSRNLGDPFEEPFSSFAKALIRLRHEIGGQSCSNHMTTVRALRYLYKELTEHNHNPILLTYDHFIRAEKVAQQRENSTSSYRLGVHLRAIVRILDENRLTKIRIEYKSSLKRPELHDRLSDAAKERREKLMPKEEVFQALATISETMNDAPDKIRMSIVRLLLFTGFRIGEALTLPANTLVIETTKNQITGFPEIDSFGKIKQKIGLRYWPEKGAEPRIKWLPTEAGKLVKAAIEEIKIHTEAAREMASWLESNPARIKISAFKPDDLINVKEIAKYVGIQNGLQFCTMRKIPTIKKSNGAPTSDYFAKFFDFYKAVVAKRWDKPMLRLKNGKSQLLSESLCVVFYEQLNNARPHNPLLVRPISEQNISDFLCGRSAIKNVFERHKYLNHDGTPYKIRTHEFRHFLNTIANEGGLTDIELAWWFGRKHIGDNQAYDHRTAAQMTEKARQILLSGEIVGSIADAANQLPLVDAKEFVATHVNAVHHTPYGLCLHDFAQNPCDKHLNCLSGCKEFHRTKGDQTERSNLKTLKAQTTAAIDHAKKEASDNTWGANNWLKHNEVIIENIDKALAIDEGCQTSSNKLIPVNISGTAIGEPL